MLCSSFGIKLDGVEFWSWTTLFWKRCWFYGQKIPSVCQCIQSQSETASQLLPTQWEMWNTMYSHFEDNQSDWRDNDYSTTLKGVSSSFWIAWFQTKQEINEGSIHANYSWRSWIEMPISNACLENALHPNISM